MALAMERKPTAYRSLLMLASEVSVATTNSLQIQCAYTQLRTDIVRIYAVVAVQPINDSFHLG